MNVLNIETITQYLSNPPRRKAFLKALDKGLLAALNRDCGKRLEELKVEEAKAREEQKLRQKVVAEIMAKMKESGITPEDLIEKPTPTVGERAHVRKSKFKLPDGRIVEWSRRGVPIKELAPFVEQYGLEEVLKWQIEE